MPIVSEIHKNYDIQRGYQWNYANVPPCHPSFSESIPKMPGTWTYAGLPVASPLGVAAGPLLNSKWIKLYAQRGFDILTYKTVRRCARDSYALPNLVPVENSAMKSPGLIKKTTQGMTGSWAVSFGMPSKDPTIWREDVGIAKQSLGTGQILSVSVVATPEEGDDLKTISEDYAACAQWAFESGADVVELNFSCPNVNTRDGMLYTQPEASREVLDRVRSKVADKPLLVKLGFINELELARSWVEFSDGLVQGLVMINCIGARVQSPDARQLFGGESRGIAGVAITEAVKQQVFTFQALIQEHQSKLSTIAVGGISKSIEVSDYLQLGVESVQVATAAMLDPRWAVRVKSGI